MRRGLLIIDRGSREKEAKEELNALVNRVKEKGKYHYCDYCFLEVVPPFIEEGIKKALDNKIDQLTIVPYFLYPGKKVKAAVTQAMKIWNKSGVKFLITKPMTMNKKITELVDNRITSILRENGQDVQRDKVDVLVICHGSKDPNAKIAIDYIVRQLKERYRNVDYCFLEIEKPDISEGITICQERKPETLVIVLYFLHEGAHVKRDIHEDLEPALEGSTLKRVYITKHIGVDETMVDLIVERAKEVEDAS